MGSSINLCGVIVVYYHILSLALIGASQGDRTKNAGDKPNIIIILADDMGFNDVSIHGSNQIPTPNIDALGIMGIQLNQMYVAPMCSPSRSSLLTGKYESNLGMQHFVIPSDEPYGLDPNEKTMADYMKRGGYRTYLVGKWHLGFHEKRYTPLYRGFDSHFGYLGPYIDYYDYILKMGPKNYSGGYDMRRNLTVDREHIGTYATDLFTKNAVETIEKHDKSMPMFMMLSHLAPHTANEYDPMQAPEDEINKFSYIQDKKRRTYAAMVSKLDEGVGKVVKALEKNNTLDNSIILFMSDNGSPIEGVNVDGHIDGKNVWSALSYDLPSPRREILAHHDEATPYMAYISDNFKLVSGTTYAGKYDRWLSEPIDASVQNTTFSDFYSDTILSSDAGQVLSLYSQATKGQTNEGIITKEEIDEIRSQAQVTCNGHSPPDANSSEACNALTSLCLFDIANDPCETTNMASEFPDIVKKLKERLDYYGSIALPIRNQPGDPRCDPANFGGIWTWWYDELNIKPRSSGWHLQCDSQQKSAMNIHQNTCSISTKSYLEMRVVS